MAVVVGGVVGSGIMRNPGVVAMGFPAPALVILAWIVGGLLVMIDAMPTVELGAAIPAEGGPYALATRVFGPVIGFIAGWADWLQLAVSTGFIAVAFGEYVQRLGYFTALSPGALAICLVLASGVLNAVGARTGAMTQNIGSALKAAGLLLLVGALFFAKSHAAPAAPPPSFTLAAAVVAMRAIYGAYGGWHAAVYFSEEVKNAERNVARATFGGIALVASLYLLVNAAVLKTLPIGAVARSNLPAADAASVVLGAGGGLVVTGLAIVAVASLAHLQIMELMRTTFAMAREGLLPRPLTRVSATGSPRASLAVSLVSTCAIIAVASLGKGQIYELLLNLYAPFPMLVFLILALGAIRLRRREPDLPRPWRMPLFPLPAILSVAINSTLLVLFLATEPVTGLASAALLALGLPIVLLSRRKA
jgi:APA family basic amino acid/polyamine antiporter